MSDIVKNSIEKWENALLADFIKVKHGYAFKGKYITTEKNNDILVTPGNFHIGGGFKTNKFKYFTDDYPEEYILQSGDIVVTMTDLSKESDTLGYSAKIPPSLNNERYLHNQRIGLLEFKNNDISRDFIYWLMRTKDYQGFIVGSASGTSIMHTSPTRICEYEFKLPPLPEQKAIAEVLSSLDDKIDLLHRQNQTLEQMAETLFRKWFVEDANESWEERPLSGIATFLNGLACQKFPPKNEIDKLPVLKIRELKDGFTANSDWATTEIDKKYLVANGDIIFSWSASLLVKIWDGGDCVLNQHLFKVTSEEFPKWFYYLWSKYHLDQFIAIAKAHATTMGHIKRGDLDDAMVFVPSNIEIEEMNKTFEPIIEKIIANNNQLNVLVSLRETLLPKLMSGEIRVEQDA
jgi:type I restriction enzyme S subunit